MRDEAGFLGRGRLEAAIERWREAGLIDAEIAGRLLAAESARRPAHTGRLAVAAFGFGALLLAAGVFLFVAANWQELSPWGRFALLVAMVGGLHLVAAASARAFPALATSLHAVGTAALGAGIFLSGQVFNLEAHWPQAFLLWALGAAVAAFLLRDWPQVLWVAVLAPAWLVSEWATIYPWFRSASGDAAQSVVSFGLVVLSTAYLSATTRAPSVPWRQALARLGAVGLVVTAASLASTLGSGFTRPTGLEAAPTAIITAGWLVAVGLPLGLGGLLGRAAAWPVAVAALLAAIVVVLDPTAAWQRLAMYAVYAAGSAGLVAWGVQERQRLRINLGVTGFALTVLAFYFSSLFDMLGRALGLIGMGVLCIVGGWLAERTRRRLIARLEVDAP